MLRSLCLVITCLGFSSLAFAELEFNNEQTKLDQLVEYYNAGVVPDRAELLASWGGRSFTTDRPDYPYGSYLLCEYHKEDPGPLFPVKPIGCYITFTYTSDYYDSGDRGADFDSRLELNKVSAKVQDNGICYDNSAQNFKDEYKGETCFKKYNNYIVYKVTKDSEVLYAGYYYIKHVEEEDGDNEE